MPSAINTIDDLRREIEALKSARAQHETAIKNRFNNIGSVFSTVLSLFKKSGNVNPNATGGQQDVLGVLAGYIVPIILDSTIFKSSNIITKAVVALLSQKVTGLIKEEHITNAVNWVKDFLTKKKAAKQKDVDYGIPPLSETY